MKKIKLSISLFSSVLLSVALTFNCYAGPSLKRICSHHDLKYTENVKVVGLSVESYDNGFNVKFSNNANYYWMKLDNDATRPVLFDVLKAAFLTQSPLDICVNPIGDYFIGANMKVY